MEEGVINEDRLCFKSVGHPVGGGELFEVRVDDEDGPLLAMVFVGNDDDREAVVRWLVERYAGLLAAKVVG